MLIIINVVEISRNYYGNVPVRANTTFPNIPETSRAAVRQRREERLMKYRRDAIRGKIINYAIVLYIHSADYGHYGGTRNELIIVRIFIKFNKRASMLVSEKTGKKNVTRLNSPIARNTNLSSARPFVAWNPPTYSIFILVNQRTIFFPTRVYYSSTSARPIKTSVPSDQIDLIGFPFRNVMNFT